MARKVIVKRNNKTISHTYDVSFTGLTVGQILSLKNALEKHREFSPVADDMLAFLNNGIAESEEDFLKERV